MKVAIYLEDGVTQIVMTPEYDFEKTALNAVKELGVDFVKSGGFYDCAGGWTRMQRGQYETDSLMLVLRQKS